MRAIIDWANANQGALALLALVVPSSLILIYKAYRIWFPFKNDREARVKNELIHAETLRKEVEANTEWDEQFSYYGEFLIRDIDRKLPETDETHSSKISPYDIVSLYKIDNEFLEFLKGDSSICYIQKIADTWYFCDMNDREAVKVQIVLRLQYCKIKKIRWDTNDYWEWPQIYCQFLKNNRFPFSHIYYAQEFVMGSRKFYKKICLFEDVQKRPEHLLGIIKN